MVSLSACHEPLNLTALIPTVLIPTVLIPTVLIPTVLLCAKAAAMHSDREYDLQNVVTVELSETG